LPLNEEQFHRCRTDSETGSHLGCSRERHLENDLTTMCVIRRVLRQKL
jgi:hypothetical protein